MGGYHVYICMYRHAFLRIEVSFCAHTICRLRSRDRRNQEVVAAPDFAGRPPGQEAEAATTPDFPDNAPAPSLRPQWTLCMVNIP